MSSPCNVGPYRVSHPNSCLPRPGDDQKWMRVSGSAENADDKKLSAVKDTTEAGFQFKQSVSAQQTSAVPNGSGLPISANLQAYVAKIRE